MAITIDKNACIKNRVSVAQVLTMLIVENKLDMDSANALCVQEGYITSMYNVDYQPIGWQLTSKGIDTLNAVLSDSIVDSKKPEADIEELAQQLKDLFPKGKKLGTNNYWAEGKALIVKRLKCFFTKYGLYSNESIIEATKKYVDSFKGDYAWMKTLKYFIYKEVKGLGGNIESTSDLLTYLENKEEEDLQEDWTINVL